MPWNVPHVAPSNIQIRPQDDAKELATLMRMALLQNRMAGGGRGAPKGDFMMVPDPDNPGRYRYEFVLGSTDKIRAANLKLTLQQRAADAIKADKDIQDSLKRIQTLDNENARKELAKLKTEKLTQYSTQYGVPVNDLNKLAFGAMDTKLQQDFEEIKKSSGVSALGDVLLNLGNRFQEQWESAGKTPEEKLEISRRHVQERQARTMNNAYLRDQALRQQTGASYFGENIAGSDVGSVLGGVAQGVESLGAMATPIAGGLAGAALGTMLFPGAGTIAGAVGGAAGAGLGGYAAEQQAFLEELQNRGLSQAQEEQAAREGVTQAGLQGAVLNAALPPALRAAGRGVQIARGAAASRMAPGFLRNRMMPAIEAQALPQGIRSAIGTEAENALANRGLVGRYVAGLPATAADVSAFTALNRIGTNLNLNAALGTDIPATENVGEEILGGAGAIPLFALGRIGRRRGVVRQTEETSSSDTRAGRTGGEPSTPVSPVEAAEGETARSVSAQAASVIESAGGEKFVRDYFNRVFADGRTPRADDSVFDLLTQRWARGGEGYTADTLIAELRRRGVNENYVRSYEDYVRRQQSSPLEAAGIQPPAEAPAASPEGVGESAPAPAPSSYEARIANITETAKGIKNITNKTPANERVSIIEQDDRIGSAIYANLTRAEADALLADNGKLIKSLKHVDGTNLTSAERAVIRRLLKDERDNLPEVRNVDAERNQQAGREGGEGNTGVEAVTSEGAARTSAANSSVRGSVATDTTQIADATPARNIAGTLEGDTAAQGRGAGGGTPPVIGEGETVATASTAARADTGATGLDGRTAQAESSRGTDIGAGSLERAGIGSEGRSADAGRLGEVEQPSPRSVEEALFTRVQELMRVAGIPETREQAIDRAANLLYRNAAEAKLSDADRAMVDAIYRETGINPEFVKFEHDQADLLTNNVNKLGMRATKKEVFDADNNAKKLSDKIPDGCGGM